MDGFFWLLKTEQTKLATFAGLDAARLSVFKCGETLYNAVRLHKTLGYRSPNQNRADHFRIRPKLLKDESGGGPKTLVHRSEAPVAQLDRAADF